MEFLNESPTTNDKEKSKKVSSTIELAKSLGILKDNHAKSEATAHDSKNGVSTNAETQENLNREFKVTSNDLDKFKSYNTQEQDKESKDSNINETIDTKDNLLSITGYKHFEFRGEAKEYFKIWIVNIALTLITLGIYSAWAKVRNNKYIYGNTFLNGSNFEFNAL